MSIINKTPILTNIIICCVMVVMSPSCRNAQDCDGEIAITQKIKANATNKISYNGNEKLYFVDEKNDTHIVQGQHLKISTEETTSTVSKCQQIVKTDVFRTMYTSQKGDLNFTFTQRYNDAVIGLEISNLNTVINLPIVTGYMGYYNTKKITVRGVVYDNVYTEANNQRDSCYYNSTDGILRIYSQRLGKSYDFIKRE
jgi:hypothetical protein